MAVRTLRRTTISDAARASILLAAGVLLALGGCATIGRVDFSSRRCGNSFVRTLSDVLVSQGEGETIADTLADETTAGLERGELSPVGFSVYSPSNSVYDFTIHYKAEGCLLRLYGRRRPGISVSSHVFFLETRQLTECACRR